MRQGLRPSLHKLPHPLKRHIQQASQAAAEEVRPKADPQARVGQFPTPAQADPEGDVGSWAVGHFNCIRPIYSPSRTLEPMRRMGSWAVRRVDGQFTPPSRCGLKQSKISCSLQGSMYRPMDSTICLSTVPLPFHKLILNVNMHLAMLHSSFPHWSSIVTFGGLQAWPECIKGSACG